MQKTTKLLAVLVLSSIGSLSIAAAPGYYLGAGAGVSALKTPKENLYAGPGADVNKRDIGGFGGRLFAGYNFNQYIGLEVGAAKYASSDYKAKVIELIDAKAKYNLYAFDLVAKGYLPLADTGLSLYALAGLAYVNSKNEFSQTITGETVDANVSQSKIRPKYGIGVSYDFPDTPVTASLEVSRIQGTGDLWTKQNGFVVKGSGIPNADMVSLNLAYNFS